ncbi:MAG: CopG family ribbon-helix-helix protein [Phenylobacterium sp.]|uniref:CopG family ribbon-helix-helix protein n=1 Tax=Phenylobacterium sp. TaxID=1871053 RepID=UPI00391DBEC0
MTAKLAITLDDDQMARLDALAQARQETAADVVMEAVREYLDYDAEFRKAVQEGLDALEAGDVRDFAEVERELRTHMTARLGPAEE